MLSSAIYDSVVGQLPIVRANGAVQAQRSKDSRRSQSKKAGRRQPPFCGFRGPPPLFKKAHIG
eukprot:scaffold9214_cov123-Skeletonema_marinoi.AAC.6